jgi:hypothetical protein
MDVLRGLNGSRKTFPAQEDRKMGSVSLFNSSFSLSSSLSDPSFYGKQTAQQAEPTPQTTSKSASSSSQDSGTVKLSTEAQAKMLYKQGESVSTIAASLGATTKDVDNYLNITADEELEKAMQETIATA